VKKTKKKKEEFYKMKKRERRKRRMKKKRLFGIQNCVKIHLMSGLLNCLTFLIRIFMIKMKLMSK